MKFIQVFNSYLNPGGEESSVGRIARHLELGGHCAQMDAIDSRNAPTVQLMSPQSREDHKLESTHAIRTENHFQSL